MGVNNRAVILDEDSIDVTAETSLVFSIANTLRGTYTPDKYKNVIIPMVIIRRFECALEPTKATVLDLYSKDPGIPPMILMNRIGQQFYNTSRFDLKRLLDDPNNIRDNLKNYIDGGALDFLLDMKKQGVVRHLGLSSHTPEFVNKVLDMNLIDMLMFSVNPGYDYKHGRYAYGEADQRMPMYHRCVKEGVGISVMKPFAGGQLLDASLSPYGQAMSIYQCLQFALDKPGVLTTVPGITTELIRELVTYAHSLGCLTITAIGTSQEGADVATIRQIALMAKMTGTDIHHLGDAGYGGMALPENIQAYSIAIRGIRHTYRRMAASVNR